MPNDLARKYRPKTLKEMIGQPKIISMVEGMLGEDPLPPAILLHGPRSSGKTTLSRIIPTYANCVDREHLEPCWECPSCIAAKMMIAGDKSHPDVEVINCAGDRGIEMTRALRERARFRPKHRYRWFILDECHRLTKDAQENFLTVLEEPPRRTRFILVTTNPEKLERTLLSRCQQYGLSAISTDDLALLLRKITKKEGKLLPKKTCKQIAEISDGFPREALKVVEQVLNSVSGEEIDPKELSSLVKDVTAYAAPAVTRAYMEGIFGVNYTLAFSAIDHIDSHEFLVARAIETVQEALYYFVDPKQEYLKKRNFYLLKGLELPSTDVGIQALKSGKLLKLLETFLKAQERVKGYLTSSRAVMLSATMEAIQNVSGWSENKKAKK